MDHQAPADVVNSTPASTSTPPHAVSAPTVSSTSDAGPSTPHAPSAASPLPSPLPQAYAPTNYPAYPYHGVEAVPASTADEAPKSFVQRLNAGEEHWKWKMGLRVLVIVIDIIAIGAASAITASGRSNVYYFDDAYIIPFSLITLGTSLVWCVVAVLVLVLRRPPRPVHPGVAVGIDLVLWLALIVTMLFSVAALLSTASFGRDGTISDYTYGNRYVGQYTQAPDGTWVYKVTYAYQYTSVKRAADGVPVPVIVDATTTSVSAVAVPTPASPVSPIAAPTPTEAPSAAAAKRALDLSSSSSSSSSDAGYYYSYSDSDDNDYYSFDDYGYGYDTSASSSKSTSTHSTVTGSDIYFYTTATRSYYRTTSAGDVLYATSTVAVTATVSRDCSTTDFASCADQDRYVNSLWRQRGRRYALDLLVVVVQCLAVVAHFVLFVWACVDTHRRHAARRAHARVALNVLQDLRSRGYVMVPAAEAMATNGPAGYASVPLQQPMSPAFASRAAEKAPIHYA